jgi:hypothetical protein
MQFINCLDISTNVVKDNLYYQAVYNDLCDVAVAEKLMALTELNELFRSEVLSAVKVMCVFWVVTFRRKVQLPSATLKYVCSSKTLVPVIP